MSAIDMCEPGHITEYYLTTNQRSGSTMASRIQKNWPPDLGFLMLSGWTL